MISSDEYSSSDDDDDGALEGAPVAAPAAAAAPDAEVAEDSGPVDPVGTPNLSLPFQPRAADRRQDKMLRANEDRSITIKLVSDYAKFLASMRDKLERKMSDVEKKGKVGRTLIR